MVEAKAQAAQLDSVTDVVQEQEVDATRALQAMNAFLSDGPGGSTGNNTTNSITGITGGTSAQITTLNTNLQQKLNISSSVATAVVIRAEDVQLICTELDVTEDVATQALRDAANESGDTATIEDKEALVVAALRKLVTS